ncbi:MAG: nucleotidyltransferase domain-containing protein [Deltaproteobacteria bacterium]|nr:nucleotidyltransferase domain-containing protein [Deltaproteobacteria bacterium]
MVTDDRVIISIKQALEALERGENVVVLLAVESGSRAWGFPCADSDYDVRFIYVRRPEWYLSIDLEKRRDVVERPLKDQFDLSGWDIRKALKLFQKSNPPLLEWLQCPIVYRERFSLAARLRALLPEFYSPKASFFHYLHMAKGNIREYLRGDIVWRKKYFYVLRPLLAMRWIDQGLGPVPIEFQKLVEATVHDSRLRSAISDLVSAKRAGAELDRGPRIPALSDFVEGEMARIEQTVSDRPDGAPRVEVLNELFRRTLDEVWQNEQPT